MSVKPRIVIDTQILLRAVVNRRSLPAKLVYDLTDSYTLLISEATLAEIEEVLHRPKVRAKFQYTDEAVAELVNRLSKGIRIAVSDIPSIARDPKDDKFLACAATGNANFIVSEDKDLLVLNPYDTIQILNVFDFLKIIQPTDDESDSD